jgi:hypothetical protein
LTDEEVSHVRSNLMDKAIDAPSLSRVVPSDPANSFLMRKLDGCFTDIQSLCVVAPAESNNKCGDVMPKTGDRLDASDRDLIRSWIQEGALEN